MCLLKTISDDIHAEGRQAGLHGLPVGLHLWRRLVEVLAYGLVMCAFLAAEPEAELAAG